VALFAFLVTAITASKLSSNAKAREADALGRRNEMARLYELSHGILLLDRHKPPGPQIAALLNRALDVESAALFDPSSAAGIHDESEPVSELGKLARQAWLEDANQDDPLTKTWCRILRLGPKAIGAVALRGSSLNPLVVDAAASISAVALERARSLERETNAEAARQSEQLRTAVLDALAHAFKTPLTAIRAASSGLLVTGTLAAREEELVTIIDDETAHLNFLATRLLQTARLEGTDVPVRRELSRMADVLDDLLSGFPEAFAGHRVDVRMSDEDAQVYSNTSLAVTALMQLLDNAIKYSYAETPIVISTEVTSAEAIISVHNQGPAIRPDERERIFERFYRSPGTEHRAPGTGLGLSIARKVAEAHGGRTWVQSSETGGTTFFLAFPHPTVSNTL